RAAHAARAGRDPHGGRDGRAWPDVVRRPDGAASRAAARLSARAFADARRGADRRLADGAVGPAWPQHDLSAATAGRRYCDASGRALSDVVAASLMRRTS